MVHVLSTALLFLMAARVVVESPSCTFPAPIPLLIFTACSGFCSSCHHISFLFSSSTSAHISHHSIFLSQHSQLLYQRRCIHTFLLSLCVIHHFPFTCFSQLSFHLPLISFPLTSSGSFTLFFLSFFFPSYIVF